MVNGPEDKTSKKRGIRELIGSGINLLSRPFRTPWRGMKGVVSYIGRQWKEGVRVGRKRVPREQSRPARRFTSSSSKSVGIPKGARILVGKRNSEGKVVLQSVSRDREELRISKNVASTNKGVQGTASLGASQKTDPRSSIGRSFPRAAERGSLSRGLFVSQEDLSLSGDLVSEASELAETPGVARSTFFSEENSQGAVSKEQEAVSEREQEVHSEERKVKPLSREEKADLVRKAKESLEERTHSQETVRDKSLPLHQKRAKRAEKAKDAREALVSGWKQKKYQYDREALSKAKDALTAQYDGFKPQCSSESLFGNLKQLHQMCEQQGVNSKIVNFYSIESQLKQASTEAQKIELLKSHFETIQGNLGKARFREDASKILQNIHFKNFSRGIENLKLLERSKAPSTTTSKSQAKGRQFRAGA